jgi:hypothetical protein
MKTQNFLLNGLSVEAKFSLETEQLAVLEQALILAQERLKGFANDPAFSTKMALAFGNSVNMDILQADWQSYNFSVSPIQI